MPPSQCPVCFGLLEVRTVAPCYICGGWQEQVERFDASAIFRVYRLPGAGTIVLCHGCELEEFMVPGGWGNRLNLGSNRVLLDALRIVRTLDVPQLGKDKFCTSCNLRLAFLDLIAEARNHASS
jgi:hypothetical protein